MVRDILLNPSRYKARFSAHANLYEPKPEETQEVRASLDKLVELMPGYIDPEQQPTLLYIVGNLAVGGLVNMNDDAVSIEDTLRIYKQFEWQQINLEHSRGEIRGFVVRAGLSEFGTDRIISAAEAREAGQPVNIAIVVALWKVADRDLVKYILQSAAPGSPTRDDLSFSFEVGFDDYSVIVLPKGTSNLSLVTQTIASSSPDFPAWDKLLRCNKGPGRAKDGSRVARVLVGDILPLGGGIVTVPAAAVKGLIPITEAPDLIKMTEKERNVLSEHLDAKTGVSYEYSSTQCTLCEADAAPFLEFAASIPEEHLYKGEEGTDSYGPKYGREDDSHCTALFGIVGTDSAPLRSALKGFGPVRMTMGKVTAFVNSDKPYDVVVVDVISEDLHRLHALIKASCECNVTWPTFRPHCTIAYTKKGLSAPYIGDTRFEGRSFTFGSLTFSPHTGARVEIPLIEVPQTQNALAEVYIPTAALSEDPHDLMSASTTLSRHLKLSPGWQERLATMQAEAGGNPLPQGVDVTLSDGRKLKGLKVFDGTTLELDKETAFHGVVITDMTPGVPPQADDSKAIHPRIGDTYPNKRAEKMNQADEFRAEQEKVQKAAYTDAMERYSKILDILAAFMTEHDEYMNLSSKNTAAAGVSSFTTKSMDLNDLKTLQASVQSFDKIEDLKTAFANVALFAEEIARASEQMALARKTAEETAAGAKTALDEVKAQLADLASKHNELVAAQAAAAAEQVYQERMASVAEIFAFDDETRAEVVSEIKACADDAAFAKWIARAQKLYKGWLKAEKAPPFGKDDKKDGDKCKEPDEDDKKAKAAAEAALATAAAKIVDTGIANHLDIDAQKGTSLKDRLMAVASKNIRIGGKTVETLHQEIAASVKKTR